MSQRQAPQALSQAQIVAKLNSVPSSPSLTRAADLPTSGWSGLNFVSGIRTRRKPRAPSFTPRPSTRRLTCTSVMTLGVAFALAVGWRESNPQLR